MIRRSLHALVAVFFVLAQAGCASLDRPTGAVGTLPSVVADSSGLIGSSGGDFLWTFNDSGDRARIFAVDFRGQPLGEIEIENAMNSDWEAITSDGNGRLLIGDIGNNENQRRDLVVYVVPEPDPSQTSAAAVAEIRYHYPDQLSFPDKEKFNFDAEALFWWKGRLFLLTKHRSDQNTALYMFPENWDEPVELIRVSEVTTGSMVTDAAVSPDGQHLAVLTYTGIWIFGAPDEGYDFLANPIKKIEFHTNVSMQSEGLAWIGDALYMSNEQRALHRLHDPLRKRFTRYP